MSTETQSAVFENRSGRLILFHPSSAIELRGVFVFKTKLVISCATWSILRSPLIFTVSSHFTVFNNGLATQTNFKFNSPSPLNWHMAQFEILILSMLLTVSVTFTVGDSGTHNPSRVPPTAMCLRPKFKNPNIGNYELQFWDCRSRYQGINISILNLRCKVYKSAVDNTSVQCLSDTSSSWVIICGSNNWNKRVHHTSISSVIMHHSKFVSVACSPRVTLVRR